MTKQTVKPIPKVLCDIQFPDETWYLKREWVSKVDLPNIPKEMFYFVARAEDGERRGIYGDSQSAFKSARQGGVTLLWAH